jgi:hypothetical protein
MLKWNVENREALSGMLKTGDDKRIGNLHTFERKFKVKSFRRKTVFEVIFYEITKSYKNRDQDSNRNFS